MSSFGLFGTACVTALTVQSTTGVRSWRPSGANLVHDTLQCLWEDLPPAGVKVGMLADQATVKAVASFLGDLPASVPIVLDPVILSSSGRELLEPGGVLALKELLLPRVSWITPNLLELAALTGLPVTCREELEFAAHRLRMSLPNLTIAATGGHLDPPDDLIVGPNVSITWLNGKRITTRATHGTGCAFSTALLCGLVQGREDLAAARDAKTFVAEAMRRAEPRGAGQGPMNLSWPLRQIPPEDSGGSSPTVHECDKP